LETRRPWQKRTFLDFEQPIAELETKIEELRYVQTESAVDISTEIDQLSKKSQQLTKDIYSDLTPWQITKIARHAERPYTLDYVNEIFTDFVELHGDRHFADDLSIVGGLARFNGTPCMVLGHQKGRDTKERGLRNFGMSKPEGYRKALRLMKTAEKFKLPVFTFVDTPGAYPGIDAEERGQSEAIGRNIFEMAQLEVPIITTIIGEGGSGGALAISVGDQVLMLQYSIYSVISPEGCASILWKTSDKAQDAADALGITAHRLKALGLVDKIVNEPVGGAHRDHKQMAAFLKRALTDAYRQVSDLKVKELLDRRYERLQAMAASPTPRPTPRPPASKARQAPLSPDRRWPSRRAAAGRGLQRRRRLHRLAAGLRRRWPGQVSAIHVHHGLQAAADGFAQHCQALCAALGVPLVVPCRCPPRPWREPRGCRPQGTLRGAGRGRPQWHGRACRSVALAQHADDQVETVLLALSRGAGLPGLAPCPRAGSAMAAYHRPLLGVPRPPSAPGSPHGVRPCRRPDQRRPALTRNRIRAHLLPALEAAFPAVPRHLCPLARMRHRPQQLLDDVAARTCTGGRQPPADCSRCRCCQPRAPGQPVAPLAAQAHGTGPSAAQLDELLDQMQACTTRGHRIRIKVGGGLCRAGRAVH
jgi:acetyl-CoA carboxylase carboxyl transferase subunit alpha